MSDEPIPEVSDDEIVVSLTDTSETDIPVSEPEVSAEDNDLVVETEIVPDSEENIEIPNEDDDQSVEPTQTSDESVGEEVLEYPVDKIDLRGEVVDYLRKLLEDEELAIGSATLDQRVRTVGSWYNIVIRGILESRAEEVRIQDALSQIVKLDSAKPLPKYLDENGKTLLKTSAIKTKTPTAGQMKVLSGDDALMAFESISASPRSGTYRVPLYNSGLTVDLLVPTGNDFQTLIDNCLKLDTELGGQLGAHYFAYADQLYKMQIISFLQPLILNSSYTDWKKPGKLWSIIKLPDLAALVMTLAAMCWKDGFDGFVTRCTRPRDETHKEGCHHTETITANLFDMVVTRFSAMNTEAIEHMVAARVGREKHSLTQIAKYQASLGLEGEEITFGNLTFTMRVPTVAEHLDAGSQFLADVMNEVSGDNTEGRYRHIGFRYMRTLLPWIATMEYKAEDGGGFRTSEPKVITRELERLDEMDKEGQTHKTFVDYINKVQLTYVGYPVIPCPSCGYTADVPSGMLTLDPFSTFFTIAFLYLK